MFAFLYCWHVCVVSLGVFVFFVLVLIGVGIAVVVVFVCCVVLFGCLLFVLCDLCCVDWLLVV